MQLVVAIENYPMTPSARCKWESTSEDVRAGLKYAFDDAIRHTEKIREHQREFRRYGHRVVEIHHLRIGFATFVIATSQNISSVIVDFGWDEPMAAKSCPTSP